MMTAETVALEYVLDEDMEGARECLRDFFPGELAALKQACKKLMDLIEVVQAEADSS